MRRRFVGMGKWLEDCGVEGGSLGHIGFYLLIFLGENV